MKEFKHTLGLLRADLKFWKDNHKYWSQAKNIEDAKTRRKVRNTLNRIDAKLVELNRAITILTRND